MRPPKGKAASKAAPKTSLETASAPSPSQSAKHSPSASLSISPIASPSTPQQALQDVLQNSASSADSAKGLPPLPPSGPVSASNFSSASTATSTSSSSRNPPPPRLVLGTTPSKGRGSRDTFGTGTFDGQTDVDIDDEGEGEGEDASPNAGSTSRRTLTVPLYSPSPVRKLRFMDHPVKEIAGVVRALCQGSPREQQEALYGNFLPDASFVHPFCRVPSFSGINVPGFGEVNSRMLIWIIFRWYKMLSPKIELEIESSVFDQRAGLLYLTICQTFAIWFIPFYRATVRLVTVLHLKQCQVGENGKVVRVTNGTRSASNDGGESGTTASGSSSLSGGNKNNNRGSPHAAGGSDGSGGRTRYMIAHQEDLYQVNEFLNFLVPGVGGAVWMAWQFFSTFLCFLGMLVMTPVSMVAHHLGFAEQHQKAA